METRWSPSEDTATARQRALSGSMNMIMSGLQNMEQQNKTKRMEALALNDQAKKLRDQGYDVTPEMIAESVKEKPNAIAKFFGAKDPEKVDLYGKRTKEWEEGQKVAASDKKFKRDNEIIDRDYKLFQMGQSQQDRLAKQEQERSALEVPDFGQAKTKEEAEKMRAAKKDSDDALGIISEIKRLGTDVSIFDRDRVGKIGQLKQALVGKLRLPLMGPGTMTEEEFQRTVSNLGDPTALFGTEENEMGKLDQMSSILKGSMENTFANISKNPYQKKEQFSDGSIKTALNPVNFRGQNPNIPFSPTNTPDISPIQNAIAAELKKVDDKSLLSRREQLLQKAKKR